MSGVKIEIPKSDKEKIIIAERSYKDKEYVDFRLWFLSEDGQELLPSKKGFTLKRSGLKQFVDGVNLFFKQATA